MWKPDAIIIDHDIDTARVALAKKKWPDVPAFVIDPAIVFPVDTAGKNLLLFATPPREWIVKQLWKSCIIFDDNVGHNDLDGFLATWLMPADVDHITVTGCVYQYIEPDKFLAELTRWLALDRPAAEEGAEPAADGAYGPR